MDAANDNDQPNSTSTDSSRNSSNNSSSSNLLFNLPMLLHVRGNAEEADADDGGTTDADVEDVLEVNNGHGIEVDADVVAALPLPQYPSTPRETIPAPPLPPMPAIVGSGSSDEQPREAQDHNAFIPPLLFTHNNNNTTTVTSLPTPSSTNSSTASTSSSSSSSHNLHHYQHHHHEHHFEHQPHSSPSPSHQLSASQHNIEQQLQEQLGDENTIADIIDATSVEVNVDVDVGTAVVISQPQQSALSGGNNTSAGANQPPAAQRTLPLLLPPQHNNHSYTHYQRHQHHHQPHQHHQQQYYNHPFLSFGGVCSNLYGFNVAQSNQCATNMFTNNDIAISGGPPHHITTNTTSAGHHHSNQQMVDRLKLLYPNVNENETPLPRCWSPQDKCQSIMLSQSNLRVHYKGIGKQHNDAASVRTAHPIPPACGLYYFEVKIISKGKNGYMGIGLTAQQFRMNRLPGWDKQSYGYHGDDGNSFSSSGNGQSYGPTFTTGDVIGCCVNFVNNTCFYTKNGIDLGIAFRDLPTKLFPTVGLQTPGEEVDANFGQEPFQFDQIEDMMKQMRAVMKTSIYDFPMPVEQGDQTTLLHKMVSTYLVHNGCSETAEAFARYTGQTFKEDLSSIRNRQKILKLVMSGKMGQAIEGTLRLYPGLLESNKNLWFMLKCRQFIEMIDGSDIECCSTNNKIINNTATTTTNTQTQTTTPNQTSVIQSTKSYQNGKSLTNAITATTIHTAVIHEDNHNNDLKNATAPRDSCVGAGPGDNSWNNSKNTETLTANLDYLNDVEMENNGHFTNGNSCNKNGNFNSSLDIDEDMEMEVSPSSRKYSHDERILEFGRELSQMGQQLENENKMKDEDRQMLDDAFSLMAYTNPWSSPLGWQLCPTKRENVCTALNSAILESMDYPRRPPLAVCVAHASQLLKRMAQVSLGACAFVNIDDIFAQN